MSKKNISVLIIILSFGVYVFRYDIVKYLMSYKYSDLVIFHGVKVPIERGMIYGDVNSNSMMISDPFTHKYSIFLKADFELPSGDDLFDFVGKLGYMVVSVSSMKEESDCKTVDSVNRNWQFCRFVYMEKELLLLEYCGPKSNYRYFENIINGVQ